MELVFLGTSAGTPTVRRNVQSVVLRLETGEAMLFDCGEGTQQQLLRVNQGQQTKLRASSIDSIFLTHLHGDHCFGLPGLLCFLDSSTPSGAPIAVYGPVGTRALARCMLSLSRTELKRGYFVTELVGGPDDESVSFEHSEAHSSEIVDKGRDVHLEDHVWQVADLTSARVEAAPLDHGGIPCVVYRVLEAPRRAPLQADVVKARAAIAGDDPKGVFAAIRAHGSAVLADGTMLEADDCYVGGRPTVQGRRVVVFGDCRPNRRNPALRLAADADVLVHEATLDDDKSDQAYERGHSTPKDAGRIARDANAKTLILWHFSPRYDRVDDWADRFRAQAEACGGQGPYLGNIILASDFLRVTVPCRTLPG